MKFKKYKKFDKKSTPYFTNPLKRKRFVKTPKFIFGRFKRAAKALLVIIFFGVVLYSIYFLFIGSGYFDVSLVQIKGAGKYVNSNDVVKVTETNSLKKNIIFLRTKPIKEILKKTFLGAKKIEVVKKFPGSILVEVTERVPLAIVYNQGKSDNFLIDSEGYVLGFIEPDFSGLPRVQYDKEIVIGKFIENNIIPITREIITEMNSQNLKVSSISYTSKYSKLYVDDFVETFIGNSGNIKNSAMTVSALIKKAGSEGKQIKKIDLRYNKVIVLYE